MTFNYGGVPNSPIPSMLSMPGAMMAGPQGFMGPMMNGQPGGGADPRHFAAMANVVIPGMNDSPLEFNVNKNKPPMPIENAVGEEEKSTSPNNRKRNENKRERDKEKEKDKDSSGSDGGLSVTNALAPNVWGGVVGMGYPVMGMNMIVDPTAAMMTMNNYSMMMGGAETDDSPPVAVPVPVAVPGTVKEIIHCKSCTLFPPNPNAPLPTTRERPPGCRTVFVGGLPENITEEIITEVFERCGEITTLRLSKKNFCHIRFVYEEYVDAAIFLSGYRIRIGSNTDAASNGRLHVDYAQARDDQYEWECRQRQLQREQRHRERMEEERLRPPSPPPVVHYTEHEASSVAEKIKQDESFSKAVQVVVTWLERGDCNKRNSNTFYSMIQSTNSHVRRLLSEKAQYEEELQKAKEIMKGRMQGILIQFGQIERVFSAACHKKVWDHFTKAQRKNIEMWKKQSTEIKQIQLEDAAAAERADDEMDVSDEEESVSVRKRPRPEVIEHGLKDDNDSLRCQLEAYKNEVEVVRSEMKAELDAREEKIRELRRALVAAPPPATDPNSVERDARIVGIVSVFLHVHPFGAGLDYLWSYLRRLEPDLRPADIEELLARFPNLFRQEVSGVGAGMERRWFFAGFRSPPPPPPPPPEEQTAVTNTAD